MKDPVLADLLAFLGDSPTPFHAVASALSRLEAAGFTRIAETDDWSSLGPGRYAFPHGGSSVLAFVIPNAKRIDGFRLVGAHTDSPNLRLKPTPEYKNAGYAQLGVEVYGGVLLNSWLDRDLSLAGRVFLASDAKSAPTAKFTVTVTSPPAASAPIAHGKPLAHGAPADTNVRPAGVGSSSTMPCATDGPALATVSV